MRATVDEKLHDTLEKRLGDSFRIVSERLEQVHKGLGEMQTLATGVGDLKRVLSNVKTRGIFGEIQLGNLLEQILTPDQYEANVVTKAGSAMRVEFAVKLPGRDAGQENALWLPIDAKFPQEDYLRLLDAQEKGDAAGAEEACRQLDRAVREMARNIRDKYLDPPATTDFGIMFLPTEGLYAEVLRRTGLCETLHRDFRVVIAGPMTLTATLNSLQMGFRTLAIERRSSEVWTLLGAVKTEFTKFGDILDKTHKKLREASDTIEDASRKTRTIERKLRSVQELPAAGTCGLIEDHSGEPEEDLPPPR
jgi:DNA recombination protein RmuC